MPLQVENAHAGFTRDFRGGIGSGELPPGVTALTRDRKPAERAGIEARFAVYRNNVMHSLSRALAQRFPAIERLVGAEFFSAMALEFIRVSPPSSPVMLRWGSEFANFLTGFPPVQSLPYLPDVARIEYARGQSYHAADIQPVDATAFAGIEGDPGQIRMELSPSLHVLKCDHGAVSIWQANQPGANPATRAAGTEYALIWRNSKFEVPLRRIEAHEAQFLTALIAGSTLEDAAAALEDAGPLLGLLLTEGLIAQLRPPEE